MPEACFLCLDSTEFMRNGDQFPNRLMAEQEAANLLVNAKIQTNAENTVGFLTTGGAACTVFETLTLDVDRVMATLTTIPIAGKRCHFANGLLIASLALSHRTNQRAEKRIVAFVGSPLQETEKELEQLAKRLRKEDVAVDVVAFGADGNTPLLQAFVDKVSKGGNSRLLSVTAGANLTDALMSSPILLGEDNYAAMTGGGGSGEGAAGAGAFGGFGIDPSVDPELAMALRLSMEDEERRQAAVAAAAGSTEVLSAAPAVAAAPAAPVSAPSPAESEEPDYANMSEEEMLRRALALSLQESDASAVQQPAPSSSSAPTGNEEEEAFRRQLQQTLNQGGGKRNDEEEEEEK